MYEPPLFSRFANRAPGFELAMANEVVVIAEHQGGEISRSTWEAIAAAQQLASDSGASCAGVVAGGENAAALAGQLAKASLAEVVALESPLLAEYTPDGYCYALERLLSGRSASYVVMAHTYQVRDFAPQLAAALGAPFLSDCLGYRREGARIVFTRQVFQGRLEADVEAVGNPLVSFQAGSFRADAVARSDPPAPITRQAVEIPAAAIKTKPGERFREARQAVDLTQAEIIVAAGRGIKSPENLELARKLADALGGELGASRPICDNGWLPMDRQIGSSGQTVAPKLYVALGISGAIQHLVGMKGSRTVVAINKDRDAPIFEVATYGVAGDLFDVVPRLIEEIKKLKGEG